MGKPSLVHQTDASQKLASNVLGLYFRKSSVMPEVISEISMLAIFHDGMEPLGTLEPAVELNEELGELLVPDESEHFPR